MSVRSYLPLVAAFALIAGGCSKSDSSAQASPSPVATDSAAATASAAASAAGSSAPTSAATATVAVAFGDISGNIDAPFITALGEIGVLDATSGSFRPNDPVNRRDFVRWLFKTNNAVFANSPSHLIHPASASEPPAFKDMPTTDPDFPYVQGMADTGISVGFPDGTFKGDIPITREQAVSIKAVLDHGGISPSYIGAKNADYARYALPEWKDKKSVSITYVGALAEDRGDEGDQKVNNIGRTFGAIAIFRPQAQLLRGEAAAMLQIIGGHSEQMMYENSMRSVDQTLHPSPSPT